MIKNIIFDLGNVLLRFAPLEYLKTKVADEATICQLHREIFLSEEWVMLDRGVLSQEEALQRIKGRSLAHSDLISTCMDRWYETLIPIDETVAVLKEVKARGYNTFVLSNFHLSAFEYVTKSYDFFKYFDGGIISYKENLLKPEIEIYDKLLAQYGIEATESLFIDDTKINIEAAKGRGLQTILFESPAQLRRELIAARILDK